MFDANLCGTPVGSNIYVKFHGRIGADKSNIQAGTYRCRVIKNTGKPLDLNGVVILVFKPSLRKVKMPESLTVTELDVGGRWVTYEGHIGK